MNTKQFKIIWITWLALAFLTTSILTFIDIAIHAPEVPTKLQNGAQLKWQVWRPFATTDTQFEMSYQRGANDDLRLNILGDKEKGIVGEPVIINLTVNGNTCTYQQNDVTGWNSRVFRQLEPMQPTCKLPEQSGTNEWTAHITQVSPKLQGETAHLGMISPAGTLKHRSDNSYGTMAEILFWGELIWLPFFLFMSIPLWLDGINRLAKRFDWERKIQKHYQKIMWNLRHKW